MTKRIYLASPNMSEEGYEQKYIQEAFDTNWLSTVGPNLTAFEEEMAAVVPAKAHVALGSGTAAVHMAVKAAGIKEGDKVACQSLTFAATVNPVIYEKATPIFIDSEPDTWNMSPEALERAFEAHPDIKAVIAVHLYGIPAKIDEIKAVCEKHGAVFLEDAAESLGSAYHGQVTGTFGDMAVLSFNGNKIITTSGGGMFLANTSDAKEVADKVRFWSTQARDAARHYQHSDIGYNYRMSNIIAGVGRGQLKVLSRRMEQKKEIFDFYKEQLGGLAGVSFMPEPSGTECNYWLSCIVLDPEKSPVRPLQIIEALDAENIESRPIWKPMHLQPVFADCEYFEDENNAGVSEYLFNNGVCLPSDTNMDADDMKRIAEIIKGLWR